MRRRALLQISLGAAAMWQARRLVADGAGAPAELAAKGLSGKDLSLRGRDVQDLAAAMRGQVLVAGQSGYDAARRVWNGMFDRHPAVIARCACPADAMLAVDFAREYELLTAVRCGGHSLSGKSTCDGGLVIDLSLMQDVRVDPDAQVARVEGGTLLRYLDRETQAFGLVTTTGTVSHTGVGGLTLGGGFGRVARRFGLACDNVRAVDIVTADGRMMSASATQNPDLLWAVRGGGGNFGVVTSFELQLHPLDPIVLGGVIAWPLAQAREVLRLHAELSAAAPDELNLDLAIVPGPDGRGLVSIQVCWSADPSRGERVLEPLRTFGKPAFDRIGAMPYVALQSMNDERNAAGRRFYGKSGFFGAMSERDVDALVELSQLTVPRGVSIFTQQGGGAIGRTAVESTAFANRGAKHWVMIARGWEDAAQDRLHIANVRSAWERLEPLTDGFYVNAMTDDQQPRIAANYGANYRRLAQLKKKYDPANQFRLNANVLPA